MFDRKELSCRLPALVAALLGAIGLTACGGGAATERGAPLVIDLRPPLVPPPPPEPVPPVIPPAPVEPEEPEEPAPPAPDLARVRSMALVTENPAVLAQHPAEYVGLYVGDEEGGIWRQDAAGAWTRFFSMGFTKIEALAYVASRHALYMTLDGNRLARLGLMPALPVFDFATTPPTLVDPGGLKLEVLATANPDDIDVLDYANVTGLAYDAARDLLFGFARDHTLLVLFPFLDAADQISLREYTADSGFLLQGVEDLTWDATTGNLLALAGDRVAVIDVAGLTLEAAWQAVLAVTDARAIAALDDATRLVVDRVRAEILRFDEAGAVLP